MHSDHGDGSGGEEQRRRDEEDVFGPRQENPVSSVHGGSSSRASSPAPEPPISRPPSSASESRGDVDDDDPFDIDALLREEEEMRRKAAAATNAHVSPVKTKGGEAGRDFMFDEGEEELWEELANNAFEDDPAPAARPGPTTSNATSTVAPQSSKPASKSSSNWDDDDAWDIFDEMEREQQLKTGNTSVVGSGHSSPESGVKAAPPLAESNEENGFAMKPGPSTTIPSKNVGATDDDWDDMYV